MGRYIDRETGGHVQKVHTIERVERVVEKSQEIDFEKLANAVAHAIEDKFSDMRIKSATKETVIVAVKDTFDETKTMESLAKSMVVQRGKSEANFDDLGRVNETQKDVKKTNDTIDLLSNLTD